MIYFKDGELLAEHNSARVYKMSNGLFLEIGSGHTLWALENELADYMDQLSDYPTGSCLEIGLGLGVASRYILTFPNVTSLTTVEVNPDVIAVHNKIKDSDRSKLLNYNCDKHRILNVDGISYCYHTKKRFDFVFIDCYDRIDEDTLPLISDMFAACYRVIRPSGKIVAWLDRNTSGEHSLIFNAIMDSYNNL